MVRAMTKSIKDDGNGGDKATRVVHLDTPEQVQQALNTLQAANRQLQAQASNLRLQLQALVNTIAALVEAYGIIDTGRGGKTLRLHPSTNQKLEGVGIRSDQDVDGWTYYTVVRDVGKGNAPGSVIRGGH